MALLLILIPFLFAGLALLVSSNRARPWLLPMAGTLHLAGTIRLLVLRTPDSWSGHLWLAVDPPGKLVLLLLSALFSICAWYAVGYLGHRQERSNRVFCACVLAFLGATTLVACSQNLGVMWVAIEATTLATAPLIYFNRTPRSIEATWKYLLIGSVGIALALLGTFFLAYSAVGRMARGAELAATEPAATASAPATATASGPATAIASAPASVVASAPATTATTTAAATEPGKELEPSLLMTDLIAQAPGLARPWLLAAFVLLLVGYGTKMGLAPMHAWKPDAYGEAPGIIGALLAGGLTSCAFLILLRVHHICVLAGEAVYVNRLLVFMGLLSMGVAGVFMVSQRDFKRMLAYSSVEHMGILVLGLGLGGVGVFGALLHMINNGMTKGVLFLSAGNIHRAFGDKTTDHVRGAMRRLPLSGTMFLLGFFAITGSPPFAPFVSEFTIINTAFKDSRYVVAGLFLLFLFIVFLGMGRTVLAVVQGRAPAAARKTAYRDGLLTGLPILVSFGIILLLGVYLPPPLKQLLKEATDYLGGACP